MSAAIVLDTETTGIDAPEVIQLAWVGPLDSPACAEVEGDTTCYMYRPSKPISLGALATHHILDEDLADCPPWPGRWAIPDELAFVDYMVGHNVDYDWNAIGAPPQWRRICTLALARWLWPANDSPSLGACLYYVLPQREAKAALRATHDARADVALTRTLLRKMLEVIPDAPTTWAALWELSERARVPTVFTFGKFKGRPISEVRKLDPSYIRWCLSGKCDIVNGDRYWQQALTQ